MVGTHVNVWGAYIPRGPYLIYACSSFLTFLLLERENAFSVPFQLGTRPHTLVHLLTKAPAGVAQS